MEFKFGTVSILELGQLISERLKEDGITQQSELCIYTDNEHFRKIDEDLFYRNKKDDNQEFVPSEGEIIINFELVRIIVKEK